MKCIYVKQCKVTFTHSASCAGWISCDLVTSTIKCPSLQRCYPTHTTILDSLQPTNREYYKQRLSNSTTTTVNVYCDSKTGKTQKLIPLRCYFSQIVWKELKQHLQAVNTPNANDLGDNGILSRFRLQAGRRGTAGYYFNNCITASYHVCSAGLRCCIKYAGRAGFWLIWGRFIWKWFGVSGLENAGLSSWRCPFKSTHQNSSSLHYLDLRPVMASVKDTTSISNLHPGFHFSQFNLYYISVVCSRCLFGALQKSRAWPPTGNGEKEKLP